MNLNPNYSYPQPYQNENHMWVYPVHCTIELSKDDFASHFENLAQMQKFYQHRSTWEVRLGDFNQFDFEFDCSIEDAVEIEHMRQMWVAMEWNQGYDDDKLFNMPASPRDIVNPIPSIGDMQKDIDRNLDKPRADDYDVTPEQMDDENQIVW